MPAQDDQLAHDAAQSVARASYGKLIAFLAKQTRDVAGAEDALSEAFAAALADWPQKGVPDNPEAWLMAVAKRKIIDASPLSLRREASMILRLATTINHASGLSGTPFRGQSTNAEAKASDKASSAATTSRVCLARYAISLP